ncbi:MULTISPECIES: D-alanyl-D-alanine carboxypeptidase family protein [Clostridium]|uniref:D-alanyl-D-alanine carboxypeptidase n=1 Tax=Clostridium cadaveris TaxID=1529 RepID=A0A1I2P8L9_9CLOT|nr:D-alanyl-D-alanine carboxypeptidase family protein [Clostridium cadaveris]MDU4950718.1 D-alanyl-D-alanine carboxypeptidase family protein [Clostridium sp.]MDM8312018.1 D-alanyl-D-alanine carboxypeptidase family protein [Clostridium cadaveris]MDY4950809.1 D-alanyl-D-alanine carboxypeptidase family protein [Clostridium cadaveris]NME63635.1 D-alanyl-D-alanine carboxypeptidase [Clostridium cadaveris]NWK10656.1 D-alanyl-D-alanine carboxypeptidase [Clostridium cadaveris]
MKKRFITSIAVTLALTILSPLGTVAKAETSTPNIIAKSAITMDIETGEIIYSKDADSQRYPASITKLMTGLLLAENKDKSDIITYSEDAKKQPEYSFNLNIKPRTVGDSMTASNSMKTLLLYSANDEAYAIADTIAGSASGFANMMNEKAKALGMKNTNYVTPNGLHDDNHYTTAYDLSILGKAVYDNPWTRETMALKKDSVQTSTGTIAIIENRNKNLGLDGCIGGKTGYTAAAGRCLLALYERDGRTLVGVVLKSAYDAQDTAAFNDMKSIIDWSYAAEKTTFYKSGSTLETISVPYKTFRFFGKEKTIDVPLVLNNDIKYYDNDINAKETELVFNTEEINPWKLNGKDKVATVTVKQRNSSTTYDLYSTVKSSDLIKANILSYILLVAGIIAVLALVIFIIASFKKRSRKRYNRRYR